MSGIFRLIGIFLLLAGWGTMSLAVDAGVVFMKAIGKHLYHEKVPTTAAHNYYTTIEGPSWQNKYCSWRTYLDQDNRNCVDVTGKKKYESILHHYDEPNADVHAIHDWGTDVLVVGSTMGLGAFRIQYGDEVWRNPQLGINIDSLVVDLIDTTYDSPKFQIAYWGWKIIPSAKINVFWTFETKKEMRSTMCEIKIDGPLDKTKVVVGMTKNSGVKYIEDSVKHNIITIGVQTEVNDSLMMAIHADEEYFNRFTSNSAHYGMILDLDSKQTAKWAFTNSWVQEPEPLFRTAGWQDKLFNDLPPPTGTTAEKNKYFLAIHDKSSDYRTSVREPHLFNLAGKVLSGMGAPIDNADGVPRVARGCYVLGEYQMRKPSLIKISE